MCRQFFVIHRFRLLSTQYYTTILPMMYRGKAISFSFVLKHNAWPQFCLKSHRTVSNFRQKLETKTVHPSNLQEQYSIGATIFHLITWRTCCFSDLQDLLRDLTIILWILFGRSLLSLSTSWLLPPSTLLWASCLPWALKHWNTRKFYIIYLGSLSYQIYVFSSSIVVGA